MKQVHNIEPIYNKESKILILGSFPSVKSREGMFFYNHPQNRFWKVISGVLELPTPETIEQKKKFLNSNKIALWDVIRSCDINNSSDSSIKNIEVNDINEILRNSNVKAVFTNGKKAYQLYVRYFDKNAILLPSTSPANAAFSLNQLIIEWSVIKDFLF